jgi:hypothetical protein
MPNIVALPLVQDMVLSMRLQTVPWQTLWEEAEAVGIARVLVAVLEDPNVADAPVGMPSGFTEEGKPGFAAVVTVALAGTLYES